MKKRKILQISLLFIIYVLHSLPAVSETVSINGFISQGYMKSDTNNYLAETEDGSFQLSDMGLKFSTQLPGRLTLGMQFYARDLGNLGNDKITIDWAFADYRYRPWLGLQVGKIKHTFGLYNEGRDIDAMRTSIFLPGSVYAETWRETLMSLKGAGIYGDLCDHLSYKLQRGITEASVDGGMAKLYNGWGFGTLTEPATADTLSANVQIYNFIEGFKIGYSVMDADLDTSILVHSVLGVPLPEETLATGEGSSSFFWVASVEYSLYNLRFSGEYSIMEVNSYQNLMLLGINKKVSLRWDMENYYANFSYRFTDWFELGIYYSVYYFDKDKKDREFYASILELPDYQLYNKDTCISLRFDINDYWTVKTDTHYMEGTGTLFVQDNKNDDETLDLEKYYIVFAAKVIYSF